jgi:hypothetical protein
MGSLGSRPFVVLDVADALDDAAELDAVVDVAEEPPSLPPLATLPGEGSRKRLQGFQRLRSFAGSGGLSSGASSST